MVSHFLLVKSFPVDAPRGLWGEGGGRVSFLLLLLLNISTCHPGLRQSTGFNNAFAICTCCCFIRQLYVRHKSVRIYGLFKDAIIYQTVQRRIVEWILNSELQKMWKEATMPLYEVTSWNISEWNHQKLYWIWPKQKCNLLTASSMERGIKIVLFCARFYYLLLNLPALQWVIFVYY